MLPQTPLLPVIALLFFSGTNTQAEPGFRPLEPPHEWRFEIPTPAYSPDDPQVKLGDFQPGIRVRVLEEQWEDDQWLVLFPNPGAPVKALIPIPNLTATHPNRYATVRESLAGFPLLLKQMQADVPWPASPQVLARRLFGGEVRLLAGTSEDPLRLQSMQSDQDASAWDLNALHLDLDFSQEGNPRIVIEFWNKGDSYQSRIANPLQAYRTLQEQLDRIEGAFDTGRGSGARSGARSEITAVRDDVENYFLPNDIQAILRHRRNEYLILELQSFRKNRTHEATAIDSPPSGNLTERLAASVKTSDQGHRYIDRIPMISQGDKGYCAAATLARVLNFYGYPVDMHALAELSRTEAQHSTMSRGGTQRNNIIQAMRRVCNATPFRLEELRTRRRHEILSVIEQGIPIIWFIPGHARLMIGVHPEGDVVYSDSWGPGHEFKTMSWNDALNFTTDMWILRPQN